MGGKMKVLSKVQVLADRNGWSLARAQGFVDGEMARRRGASASTYARVGIDEYCLGFRAGYYERGVSPRRSAGMAVLPLKDTVAAAAAGGAGAGQAVALPELESPQAAGVA
jgi:hypothetical protein